MASMDFGKIAEELKALMPKTTQRTEEELLSAGENKYNPIYNAQVEGAQQAQQGSDLALAQQIERLLPEYQRNAANIQQNTASAISQQGRQALQRGMQRSSYGQATVGGLQQAGIKALAQNDEQHTMNVNQINDQRAKLEQDLAQTLGRLQADKASVISGYTDEMRQQDLTNAMSSYQMLQDLQLQLSQMEYQQKRDKETDRQWQAMFDAQNASRSSGSSGRSSSSSSSSASSSSPSIASRVSAIVSGVVNRPKSK